MSSADHLSLFVVATSNYNAPILTKGCFKVKRKRGNRFYSTVRGAVLRRRLGGDMAEPNSSGSLNGHVPDYRSCDRVNMGESGHQWRQRRPSAEQPSVSDHTPPHMEENQRHSGDVGGG